MPRAHSRDFHWEGNHYEIYVYSNGSVDCDRIGTCFGRCAIPQVTNPERDLPPQEREALAEHRRFERLKATVIMTFVVIVFAACGALWLITRSYG